MKTNFRLLMLLFFVGACCLMYYFTQEKPVETQCIGAGPMTMECGTPKMDSLAIEGKKVFNSNCAACHKMNVKSSGPALGKILSEYTAEKMSLYDYVHGKRSKLLFKEDKVYDSIGCTLFPDLTKEDVSAIEKYAEAMTP